MGTHNLSDGQKEKMKLTVALLAAVAESKPNKGKFQQAKEVTNGDSKAAWKGYYHVPALECSADMIASIVNDDGQSGTVSMDDHGNKEHCFVNLGEQCEFGVDVEITHMLIETFYYGSDADTYATNDPSKDINCFDAVFFAYSHHGKQHKTTQQCGCVADDCSLEYFYDDWSYEYYLPNTILPTKYTLAGDDTKMVFHSELFHTNLENENTFMEQLESGHREMWYNGNKLDLNAPCGFTVSADGVHIDWAYDLCNVTPTMNDNEDIVYSVSLSSPGNAPGYPTIEFYVDSAVEASCAYNSKVVVNADGFWVNQEDVNAAGNAMGKLDNTFHCKFYDDEARSNQILSNNIVNMGEMIYGQVTSDSLTGLSYELVGVTVTNANNLAMSYPVINGGVPSPDVHASSDGSAQTGQSVNFSYLSFGFESETGTNQNELNIECAVDVFITPERPMVGGNPCLAGPAYFCAHAEECGLNADDMPPVCSNY